MICRVTDLNDKEVVNINNGSCLGTVSDVEIDTCTARVGALIIFGKAKCFGLMGHEEDTIIRWENIQCIGEDTVLVRYCKPCCPPKKNQSIFEKLFG